MEYRQYHNLTETYLSQVNEETKQEQLDESVGLALKGLRAAAPVANRIAQFLLGAETAALGTTAIDEFEGEVKDPNDPNYGVFDPRGDYDGDGILNQFDVDVDGDGLLDDVDDDNPYGGFGGDQAGKRIIKLGTGTNAAQVNNPLDPIIRASDKVFIEYPTQGVEYLYNLLADIFEETEKQIGRPLLTEEKQKILKSKQLNEALPLVLRALAAAGPSILKYGGQLLKYGGKQLKPLLGTRGLLYGTGAGVAGAGDSYITTRDAQAMKDRNREQVDAINDQYFDDDRTMQEQETIDAIFAFIELFANSPLANLIEPLLGITTEAELLEFLTDNIMSVTQLYALLAQYAEEYADQLNPTSVDETADRVISDLMARFPGMSMEQILEMLVALQAQGAETLGDVIDP
jgi:hypothetical protein